METTSRWVAERIANVHETNGVLTSASWDLATGPVAFDVPRLSLWIGDIQRRRNIRTLTHRQKGLLTFPPQTRGAHFTTLNRGFSLKKFHPKCITKEVDNVLWKIQLGNVLWKTGHIPNSVCFHRSSLTKTSCSWLIWVITEQRWVINEQLRALLLSLNHYSKSEMVLSDSTL